MCLGPWPRPTGGRESHSPVIGSCPSAPTPIRPHIAMPWMGCGRGGLNKRALSRLSDARHDGRGGRGAGKGAGGCIGRSCCAASREAAACMYGRRPVVARHGRREGPRAGCLVGPVARVVCCCCHCRRCHRRRFVRPGCACVRGAPPCSPELPYFFFRLRWRRRLCSGDSTGGLGSAAAPLRLVSGGQRGAIRGAGEGSARLRAESCH